MIEALKRNHGSPKVMVHCDECGLQQEEPADYERTRAGTWHPNEGQVIQRLQRKGWTYVKGTLRCLACSMKRKDGDVSIAAKVKEYAREDRTVDEIASLAKVTRQQVYACLHNYSLPFKRSEKNTYRGGPKKRQEQVEAKVTGNNMDTKQDAGSDVRQPTQAMKREILMMLGVVYDTSAGRYKEAESDVTVADAIGNGCMFGWVAQLREEFFGPDGRSIEMGKLAEDLEVWITSAKDTLAKAEDALMEMAANRDALRTRLADALSLQRRLDTINKAAGPRARV